MQHENTLPVERRKAGRPNVELNARQRLLESSRNLFTVLNYEKVSTRLIAKKAGVNSSMIRYYFGNKEGLFETMVRETLEPMKEKIRQLLEKGNQSSLLDLMRTYYGEMIKIPLFPRLMIQVMLLPPTDVQHQIMKSIFLEISEPMRELVFEKLQSSGAIRKDMSPYLCRMSYFSLLVFPFITPPAIYSIHNMEMNEEFLLELFEHNIKVMKHGFLSDDEHSA
ncbi:TetR/AcrR family transcriptional regulator [Vibrio sp. S4M6]|uniref:TetR/AcrR family transcriptional regulator n=1 Tax=Vibrio sinus TaxID=2946865 RepID=UPI00202A6143|nr:TetR/AcrR family transcriptional regulator [Vibrio sinus]MCL9781573.1 TetR/AcrR family transcriptional regulator [Vibrio sinus]